MLVYSRVLCLLLIGGGAAALSAQSGDASTGAFDTDVNRVLAQANRALDQQQYDQAAELYRSALRLTAPLPEAEYGLALIFDATGVKNVAERQYLRALGQRTYLRTPELVYEIHYRLAALYLETGDLFKYENQLTMIVADDRLYAESAVRTNTKRLLYERGFNRLFRLYRFDSTFALAAHAQLAEHYVRSGNYGQAVEHAIFAFLLRGRELLAISQPHVINAEEQSYSQLFLNAQRIAPIRNQLQGGYDIYRLMYYLGAALYGDNPRNLQWRAVLSLLSEVDSASPWVTRAQEHLATPALEPLY